MGLAIRDRKSSPKSYYSCEWSNGYSFFIGFLYRVIPADGVCLPCAFLTDGRLLRLILPFVLVRIPFEEIKLHPLVAGTEADKWSRLCDLSVYDKYEFRWYGPYLCLGDAKSVIIHTMTEQGVKYVSRIILPDGLMYPPGFGIDGKGTLYITMGSYYKSGIIRYDDNGKYTTLPFSMFGYETFREGCIPVPGHRTHDFAARIQCKKQ